MNDEEPPPEAVAQFVHTLAAHLVQHAPAQLEKVLLTTEVESRPLPLPIPVDILELHAAHPFLANWIIQRPAVGLPCLTKAIQAAQERILAGHPNMADMTVKRLVNPRVDLHRLSYPELHAGISHLRCSHAGKLLHVRGTVIRAGASKVIEAAAELVCSKCKHRFVVHASLAQGGKLKPPRACPAGTEDGGEGGLCPGVNFKVLPETTLLRDYQEVKLQESASGATGVPRSVTVVLEDDLVDSCRPGDDVFVTGVLTLRWIGALRPEQACHVQHFLHANCVVRARKAEEPRLRLGGGGHAPMAFMDEFAAFWQRARADGCPLLARNHILNSVCPQIFGLSLVKLAVALCLIGGVARQTPDGTSTRGEVHCLLAGDPGTGKSQFLRYAARLSPRAVMTTGKGSSSAGLTVTAVKDHGEWVLEAGALVLADGGVCCIDEFNCIQEADKVVIHEAMEQQTISVAKAGLVTTLETKCSIFAVMNMKNTYDRAVPLAVSTGLAGPLLSRFDVVLVILDEKQPEQDRVVTRHILETHAPGCTIDFPHDVPVVAGAGVGALWALDKLRAYVAGVKSEFAPVLTVEAEELLGAYYASQRRAENRTAHAARTTIRMLESLVRLAQAHARLMFQSSAGITDACMAILIMDSTAPHPLLGCNENPVDETCCGETPDQDFVVHEQRVVSRLKQELEDIDREQSEQRLELEQATQDAWAHQPPGESFVDEAVESEYDRWLKGN